MSPLLAQLATGRVQIFLLLLVLSLCYSAAARRIESSRFGLSFGRVVILLDVWTMAGALLLPLPLVAALAVAVYGSEWPTRRKAMGAHPGRYAVSATAATLATVTGSVVYHAFGGFVGVVGAMLSWQVADLLVLVPVILIFGSRKSIRQMLTVKSLLVDLLSKLTGVGLALVMAWHPFAAILAVPVIFAAHLLALADSVRSSGSSDLATGTWLVNAWKVRPADLVAQAPAFVVLIVVQFSGENYETKALAALARPFVVRPAIRVSLLAPLLAGRRVLGRRRRAVLDAPRYALGWCGVGRIALATEVDLESAGRLIARDVRARLGRAGVRCSVGSAVGAGAELSTLLAEAEKDLQFEDVTAGFLTPDGG